MRRSEVNPRKTSAVDDRREVPYWRRAQHLSARTASEVIGRCFREEEISSVETSSARRRGGARQSSPAGKTPNKSPEPTRGAVTPRAIESKIEMALQTEFRHAARVAPAPRVAHL